MDHCRVAYGYTPALARGQRGQATVEAAVELPSGKLVFALLLQPACLSKMRAGRQ